MKPYYSNKHNNKNRKRRRKKYTPNESTYKQLLMKNYYPNLRKLIKPLFRTKEFRRWKLKYNQFEWNSIAIYEAEYRGLLPANSIMYNTNNRMVVADDTTYLVNHVPHKNTKSYALLIMWDRIRDVYNIVLKLDNIFCPVAIANIVIKEDKQGRTRKAFKILFGSDDFKHLFPVFKPHLHERNTPYYIKAQLIRYKYYNQMFKYE